MSVSTFSAGKNWPWQQTREASSRKAMRRVWTGDALDLDVGSVEGVGLPHFVGVGLGEGQALLVGALGVGLEQFVLLDDAAEGVGRDLRAGEQALLDAEPIEDGQSGALPWSLGSTSCDGLRPPPPAAPCGSCPCRSGVCFP